MNAEPADSEQQISACERKKMPNWSIQELRGLLLFMMLHTDGSHWVGHKDPRFWSAAGEFIRSVSEQLKTLEYRYGRLERPRHLVLAVSSKIKVICHSCIFIVFLIQCILSHLQHNIIEDLELSHHLPTSMSVASFSSTAYSPMTSFETGSPA